MKKIYLLGYALMASTAMFAQTTLWDGENFELNSKGDFWDRCDQTVVENPSKDGINTSDKCLKFTITGNEWNNGSAAKGLTVESFDSKRLSLMIKKDVNSNVRVEIKCNDEMKKVVAWYDGNGEWRKLYFDFSTNNANGTPTEITIYPTTDAIDNEQIVYIDNIQIEDAPKVGDVALADCSNLTGNIKLTGAWLKGECQNADGDWQKVEYNDFTTLGGKLTDGITSIDMRGTVTKNADINAMRGDRANVLIFSDDAYEANNVVANGTCANLVLNSAYAFATPENFQATSVSISRQVFSGDNTLCLPCWVSAEELSAKTIATYSDKEDKDGSVMVKFAPCQNVDANVPFVAQFDDANAKETLTFTNKGIVQTPSEMGDTFIGTYSPMSGNGKYGLNANGKFQKGGESATLKAFSAYLNLTEDSEAKSVLLSIEDETTGINAATVANNEEVKVYNLQGCLVASGKSINSLHLPAGVYVVNGKKVVVK